MRTYLDDLVGQTIRSAYLDDEDTVLRLEFAAPKFAKVTLDPGNWMPPAIVVTTGTRPTHKRPFTVFRPATETRPAEAVEVIEVEVWIDEDGAEMLTPESVDRIDQAQRSHMIP